MGIIQVIAITASLSIFIIVIELIRRNHLKERYSLLWLSAGIFLIVFSIWRKLLDFLALRIGIFYPPSFLFLLAIIFLVLLLLHFSIIVSSLSENNKRLAQELGILKAKLNVMLLRNISASPIVAPYYDLPEAVFHGQRAGLLQKCERNCWLTPDLDNNPVAPL